MLMLKTKFAKFVMGLMVVSVMSLGAVSTVNATEIQPDLDNTAKCTAQEDVQKESCTNYHAAAQFTYNEDGDKILTVTPKSEFRSHHANCHNDLDETPVVDEVTPAAIVDEETPVVVDEETPVVDEETPVVDNEVTPAAIVDEETPLADEVTPAAVVDEETPVVDEEVTPAAVETPEITKMSIYDQLVKTYAKLLNLYETLLNNFDSATAVIDEETPVVDEVTPAAVVDEETPVVDEVTSATPAI